MPEGNPQAYFNPMTRGGGGPSPRDMPEEILALLEILAQSGAGPAAEAIGRNKTDPNADLLRSLILSVRGSRPNEREMAQATRDVGRRMAPPQENMQPETIGDSNDLLRVLLDNS